jgi:hypothetical protein
MPKTEEQYKEYFMSIQEKLNGQLVETITNKAGKGKKTTETKKRLLDITPELEKIIRKYEDLKQKAGNNSLEPMIEALLVQLNTVQRTEITAFIMEFKSFRESPWPYASKLRRQDELHQKIRNCQSWYVTRVNQNENFEEDTRTLISDLSFEIECLQEEEIKRYLKTLNEFRHDEENVSWAEFADTETQMQEEIQYCKKWYVENDDFNQYEEQLAERVQIARLQEEITKTEAYMTAFNVSMSTPTAPGKNGGKGKKAKGMKAHMPIESEHVEMSTLLSLLREVCVRFDT